MNKLTISECWKLYREMVVPNKACDSQITDTKRAFYAGGKVVFEGMMKLSNTENDDDGRSIINGFNDELLIFGENVIAEEILKMAPTDGVPN